MTTTAPANAPQRGLGVRSIAAGLCLTLATLLLPVGLVAFWGQRTLTDTDQFVAAVGPLANDPEVIDSIARTVSIALTKNADLEDNVSNYLPDFISGLSGPISSVLPEVVYRVTVKLLSTEQAQEIWTKISGDLQQATINALEGNSSGPVTEQDGQIVLDTGDVITAVKEKLSEQGFTVLADQPTPPAADRQIVLLNSQQVDQAQRVYSLTKPIATFLIFIVIALFAAAILFARRRGRMVAIVGLGVVVGAGILRIGMAIAPGQLESSFADTPFALSASVFFTTLTSFLLTSVNVAVLLGVVLLVVGWLCSNQQQAVALRGRFRTPPPA